MSTVKKILLVDDDLDFVAATRAILETKSYKVLVAYNGNDGLRLAEEESPDLILLDVIMPVRNGFSVASELKKNPKSKGIPTLMLTAFAEKRGESSVPVGSGFTLETEDYLDKSVGAEELLDKIELYISK